MSDTGDDYTAAELNRMIGIDNKKIEDETDELTYELVSDVKLAMLELYGHDKYRENIL